MGIRFALKQWHRHPAHHVTKYALQVINYKTLIVSSIQWEAQKVPLMLPGTIALPRDHMQLGTWALHPGALGPAPDRRRVNPNYVRDT